MHDDSQGSSNIRISDPLRGAPPPGCWVLLHGPHASAVLDLARDNGKPAVAPPDLPPVPSGFPASAGESLGSFLLENGGRRFFLRGEVQNSYVSCFLCHLPASAG